MTIHPARQPKGISAGGQFAATAHPESSVSLGAPVVDPSFVQQRLDAVKNPAVFTLEQLEQISVRLNESRNFSDANIEKTAEEVHHEVHGYSVADAKAVDEGLVSLRLGGKNEQANAIERAIASRPAPHTGAQRAEAIPADGITAPVPSNDPRVRAGQVFDRVVDPEHGEFHRRRPGVSPNEPYAMRFQMNRELDEEETEQVAGLIGYSYRANVRGEPMGMPVRDTPYSFIVYADTTKSASDDLGMALEEFEENLPEMILHGSPVRTTNRSGPGTQGTRLVEGLNDEDLKFELYYDSVFDEGR